jgi:multidrug transporter EmrE-like cation transporter
MKYSILGLIFLGGILFTIGDVLFKKWAIEDKYIFYGAGMALYILGTIAFAYTLREKNLAIASTILDTTNMVFLVLISYFYFQEKLTMTQLA